MKPIFRQRPDQKEDPVKAERAYRAMLRDTGRDTVDGIVRRHCGADAANPAFWETAMQAPLAAVKAFAALSSSK